MFLHIFTYGLIDGLKMYLYEFLTMIIVLGSYAILYIVYRYFRNYTRKIRHN
jgi:hypothetical protein